MAANPYCTCNPISGAAAWCPKHGDVRDTSIDFVRLADPCCLVCGGRGLERATGDVCDCVLDGLAVERLSPLLLRETALLPWLEDALPYAGLFVALVALFTVTVFVVAGLL